ncbi:hypothetical protein [Methanobacterium lacus]|nr:hypothetical protein [Methanobacterium lacus]
MVDDEKLIEKIYQSILNLELEFQIYVKGQNGLNNIVLFDEPELYPREKARFRIGNGSILIFDGEKPILAIEIISNKPTSSKEIAGPIPVYMISRKIKLNYKDGTEREIDLLNKFPLLVVVPDQSKTKTNQINDLNEKFRGIFKLNTEYSALNYFRVCVESDFDYYLKKLLSIEV